MAVFAVYIQKQTDYFGEVRPFGNTYHYETAPGQTFADEAIAEEIKDAELLVTQSDVQFIGWRTWGPTDGPAADNVIRAQGEFNEPGLAPSTAAMYAEACALVVWEISRSPVLNRRRWLRKFVRLPGAAGSNMGPTTTRGEAPMSQVFLDALFEYGQSVASVGGAIGEAIPLSNEQGDGTAGLGSVAVRPYLHTRQIGD